MAEYDPVTGENWNPAHANSLWNQSMSRANYQGPRWTVQGLPERNGGAGLYWRYFNFRPWYGRVTVEPDGFHWSTHVDYDGATIHEGVTTSIYEAYQSVVQNRPVSRSEVPA